MIEEFSFLAAPITASLSLVAILGYLGLHVLKRQVIFVDLALAQIAALGTVIALVLGHEVGSLASVAYSLSTALLGAAVFSWSRTRRQTVPQEAVIGITYVIATAATLLIADRAPEGAEHIKEVLAGAILWVTWPTIGKDALVFLVIGTVHYLLRKRFLPISEDPEEAFRRGYRVRWWDFLFYATFAVVITLAVAVAGVLMVFAFLVAPAIVALAATRRWDLGILIAWSIGGAASAVGLLASYRWDLPSGPAVVCALGGVLAVVGALAAGRTMHRGAAPGWRRGAVTDQAVSDLRD